MNKQDYLDKKATVNIPYAGYVCPKCHQGSNNKQNLTLPEPLATITIKRYGKDICDDCKLKIINNA